jgi:hypothetical protein
MRIETNQALIERNKKISQYSFFFSLITLALGFIATNARFLFPNTDPSALVVIEFLMPIVILPLAFGSTLFSVRMTNLWIRQPRPEKALEENLKGLGNKAVLYNYYHFPARHVLIAPQGVFAIVTRFQQGAYTVNGDRWKAQRSIIGRFFGIFRMDGIGNPSQDARAAAEHIKKVLQPIAPDVPVHPIILFVDPTVKLTINQPTVPVLNVLTRLQPNFKDYLKTLPKASTLTPQQITTFEAATGITAAK